MTTATPPTPLRAARPGPAQKIDPCQMSGRAASSSQTAPRTDYETGPEVV